MLLRSPGFTLVAVLTLAVGIAANTTVFSWVDMMLLRPIPGATRSSDLVSFEEVAADGGPLATSYRDFRDYRDHLTLVSGLSAAIPATLSLGSADRGDRIWGEFVSGNYFAVLGVRPALGGVFSREEYGDQPGAYPVVVLGHSLWQRRFKSDPNVIGSTLLVNRHPMTIIGVAPPEFHGSMPGLFLELWAPVVMAPQLGLLPESVLDDRNARMLTAVARLGPRMAIEQAGAECSSLARRLAETNPHTNERIGATLLPVRKSHFGGQTTMEGPLRILMAACGLVFLVVCANVSSLLLARATARRKEFGLRMTLGAGRTRLLWHTLSESLLLAVLGALVGVPLAMWMSSSLLYLMPRGAFIPVSLDIPLNGDILGFTVLVCAGACLFSGMAPALQGARASLSDLLKEGGRGSSEGAGSNRLRSILVAVEVALALVAIIGAGLFAKSFYAATRIDPGFDPRNVLVAHIDLSAAGYGPTQQREFCDRLRTRVTSQLGIVSATPADVIPLWFTGNPLEGVQVEGYVPNLSESMKIPRNVVGPGYLDLMRIPLLEGRDIDSSDTESARRVMIVNQTFADRYFHDRSALGRRVHAFEEWYTVVGIARDSKYVRPTEAAQPYFYVPFQQAFHGPTVAFHVRTVGDPDRAASMLQREVNALDPAVRTFDSMPMTEATSAGLFGQKIAAVLLVVLGIAALALAATGLYSVMAYSVARRTQEIGIRMALGARRADVLALVIRQGMILTLIGVTVGVAIALMVTRLAASLLIGVSATDPLIFVAASLFLLAIAFAANYIPARRATRVDPNDALRCQ